MENSVALTTDETSVTSVKWTVKKRENTLANKIPPSGTQWRPFNNIYTYWVTNKNMIASKALLAAFLKMKLAAIPIEYTLVRDFVTSTPNTLNEMKNRIARAKNNKILSRVFKAAPTSRILLERKRRSL